MAFVDGRLRPVEGPDLLLASGPLDSLSSGQAWGCEDVDGDGLREIIAPDHETQAQRHKDARPTHDIPALLDGDSHQSLRALVEPPGQIDPDARQ